MNVKKIMIVGIFIASSLQAIPLRIMNTSGLASKVIVFDDQHQPQSGDIAMKGFDTKEVSLPAGNYVIWVIPQDHAEYSIDHTLNEKSDYVYILGTDNDDDHDFSEESDREDVRVEDDNEIAE